ncbi:hypothetical protein F5Y04DRAFT_290263 [Hypomontagnella monticulosa]|nr:hypothetical protein F5Y04DRAFT_290263 [Hypomontagnella monticulosa]
MSYARDRDRDRNPMGGFMPDTEQLFGFSRPTSPASPDRRGAAAPFDYEGRDLNVVMRRHLENDIMGFQHDLECWQVLLETPGKLTAEESRTYTARFFDMGHNIRRCEHEIEILDVKLARTAPPPAPAPRAPQSKSSATPAAFARGPDNSSTPNTTPAAPRGTKRRHHVIDSDDSDNDDGQGPPGINTIQRLGYWKCRLCTAEKFLDAGSGRVPTAPCKGPLRDLSKVVNHFLEMHTEHDPYERCEELGAALDQNRGPFEYWLTRTKNVDLEGPDYIDDLITDLQSGELPNVFRQVTRSGSKFPKDHGRN